MDHTVSVLDHGLARLVSYTQPAVQAAHIYRSPQLREMEEIEQLQTGKLTADYSDWTGDLEVIRNARVSYDAAWRAGEDEGRDTKLINYLLKNQHWSPFESMHFTFEVKAPIFVLRQWQRHWSWSFNEVSARYSELPEEFYVPDDDKVGKQAAGNKQMRDIEGGFKDDLEKTRVAALTAVMELHNVSAFETYRHLLDQGVPRELARTVLPLATYSHMFATVSLRDLMIFCALRMHPHAQYEIRVYAEAMLGLIEPICPVAVQAFRDHVLKQEKPAEPVARTVVGVAKGMRKHF